MAAVPTNTFKNKCKFIIDSDDLQLLFFGQNVLDLFKDAKTGINNYLNPWWIVPSKLPSGVSIGSWYHYLRSKYYLEVSVLKLANSSVSAAWARKGIPNFKYHIDEHREEIQEKMKT
jgi:hypothetical protein